MTPRHFWTTCAVAILSVAASIGVARSALAQVTVEEAQQRLEERQKERSDPESFERMEAQISSMKVEIANLRAEVASIRADRDRLAAQVASRAQPATRPAIASPTQDAIDEKRLAIGMTIEQAQHAMGGAGKLVEQSESGSTYAWQKFAPGGYTMSNDPGHTVASPHFYPKKYLYTQFADFDAAGKLIRISRDAGSDRMP